MSIVGDYKDINTRRKALHPEPYAKPVEPYDGPTTRAASDRCAGCVTPYLCGVSGCSKAAPDMGDWA